jgi:uncharacterized surface protein with fasciclin (FAS1) repeats
MSTFKLLGKSFAALLLASCLLQSCSDMSEYFETPSWLKGSIMEELKDDGNYTIFLQGVEKAGFSPILNGKSILTVMAPTDDAMRTYLQANYNTTDISQLSDQEVKKLIGFHILYYSFDKDALYNFRPNEGDGATDDQKAVNAGLYFKFRTKSQDPISVEQNKTDSTTYDVSVYHLERYVPVFSAAMFQTKTIDAATNYNYFYPDSWKGGSDGFNVANAGVDDYAEVANNGYIYKVDKVLKPLETIYSNLKSAGKYTKYLAMYDQYSNYQKDANLTLNYGNGTDLYLHEHNKNGATLAPIACEWPVTQYTAVADLAYKAYSVFAPTDDALNNFFNDYWKEGGYGSLDEVSSSSIQDILMNSYYDKSLVFPEEITKGYILNANNDNQPIKFDISTVAQADRVVCSNGVLYGCSVLTPPAKYGAVTGPAYQYKKFSAFQNMLSSSGLVSTLSSSSVSYIMLYPDNDQMLNNGGIQFDANGTLISDASPKGIGSSVKSSYVYAHVCAPTDGNTVLPESGKAVYQALSPGTTIYWYVKNGKITNSIKHNELLKYADNATTESDVFVSFAPLAYRGNVDGWNNGHCYTYDKTLFEGSFDNVNNSKFVATMYSHRMDATTEFYAWINLLDKAGMMNRSAQTVTDMTENCLMFVPTTTVLEKAIKAGEIPGISGANATVGQDDFISSCEITDETSLQKYLKRYFVPLSTAVITHYPYVGWGENTESQGGLVTLDQQTTVNNGQVSIVSTNLNIYDDGTKLTVGVAGSSKRVSVTADYDYFPFIFVDGPAHFLSGTL